jgi:hypothetical protein
MKLMNFVWAAILALTLSFDGISGAQTASQFPVIDRQAAFAIALENCGDVVFTITGYSRGNELRHLVYDIGNKVFAVIEFTAKDDRAFSVYVLQPDKKVMKFLRTDFDKIPGVCETISKLGLKNGERDFQ